MSRDLTETNDETICSSPSPRQRGTKITNSVPGSSQGSHQRKNMSARERRRPGSGLGVAGLVQNGADHVVVPTEGGHATIAADSLREEAILNVLRQRYGHVSGERILSGPGIENLYQIVAALDGTAAPPRDAAQITVAALEGACPTSLEALNIFCAMLGGFAGNLALTYGARGGVYIAGGIAPRILEFLANSEFRRRFEKKGRLAAYLKAIPTQVIVHPAATFLGLRSLLGFKSPVSR
jgi:glucokinase